MKKRLQQLVRPTLMVLGVVVIVATLGFVEHSTDHTPVKELQVDVDAPEGVHFIDEDAVRKQVLSDANGVIGTAVGDVDMVGIESRLRNIGCVAKANVYHTMDGVMHVTVKQREPIVRVINADGSSFYIDREGWTMPMSENYTARVLVVTGQLFEPFANGAPVNVLSNDSLRLATRSDDIYAIAKTITKDQFWNALFDQAVVDANGGFELIPRVGAQTIRIGDGADLPRCLNKLMTFYHGGMPQADWRKYSVIDLRFADQIVCTRRGDAGVAPVTNRVTQASPRQPMR